MIPTPDWLTIDDEVAEALRDGRAVVALESTVITHGLPRPVNFELACEMEAIVRQGGAVPATVAVTEGLVRLGLKRAELERLALSAAPMKVSRRELAVAIAQTADGGTTVAATAFVAQKAGIQVFATGGIGGVHRGDSGDISADLPALAETPIGVVCSGAKAILNLPKTLEWLETGGVPVLGWKTDELPAFVSRSSGLKVPLRVDEIETAAAVARAHWAVGLQSAVLLTVPCPDESAVPDDLMEDALQTAERGAKADDISGGALTPYLLSAVSELTSGASLRANLALLRNNAHLAAEWAAALSTRS
jgi:pseudouridine-5'-phosphate glycosidase